MDYRRIYRELIERARGRLLEGYTETHHIVPRCMGGTNALDNLVKLTPEEHWIAHQLLVKMHPHHRGVAIALNVMVRSTRDVRRTHKLYGWAKRRSVEALRLTMAENNPNAGGKANRKYQERYVAKHGKPPPPPAHGPNWRISDKGKKILSGKMTGENNPCFGISPWFHPRATEYTKTVWANAHKLHDLWNSNGNPSYGRLYKLWTGTAYTHHSSVISPYMNVIRYFREGWTPMEDKEWFSWRQEYCEKIRP